MEKMKKAERMQKLGRFLRHPIRQIAFKKWKKQMVSNEPIVRAGVGRKLLDAVNDDWDISEIEKDIKKYIDDNGVESAVKALVRHYGYKNEKADDSLLKHPEKRLRDVAVGELVESYGTSPERVIELLKHENPEIRRRMAHRIIERNKRCIFRKEKEEVLLVLEKNAFNDPEDKVRYANMMALGACYFNDAGYINGGKEKLLELLNHEDMTVRRSIAYMLQGTVDEDGFQKAIELLEGNTHDEAPVVESAKVTTLSNVYYLTENKEKLQELTEEE